MECHRLSLLGFGLWTVPLVLFAAGMPLRAAADDEEFAAAASLQGENPSPRTAPAKISRESADALVKQGFVRLGEISCREVTGTYWRPKNPPDRAPVAGVTAKLCRRAANRGGDLVVLAEDNLPVTARVTKRGKALTWMKQSRQEFYQQRSATGDAGYQASRTVYYDVPTSWETIEGTECSVRSTATVWRRDPELSARIAPRLQAERQARLQQQAAVQEVEDQAARLLREAERQTEDRQREAEILDAVTVNDVDKVKALLARGVSANARDNRGTTPLHYAAMGNVPAMVQLLLAKGADLNRRDDTGMTPLHLAAYRNSRDAAELLLAKGADERATNKNGATPLHLAATADAADVTALLLARGADVTARTARGRTPLHLAALQDSRAVAELLLAKGADLAAKDGDGGTPLALAIQGDHAAMADLLRARGAKE